MADADLFGVDVVVIVWYFDSQLLVQSVRI
jgi:hypothetical protein